jgi:SPP1 family predicted phage head-tail adaptor
MEAGKLRGLITIKQPVRSRGASGEEILTWNSLASVFAQIQPLAGREYFSIAKKVGEELVRFVIWIRDDVSTEMRILHKAKTYAIREIRYSDDVKKMILIGAKI